MKPYRLLKSIEVIQLNYLRQSKWFFWTDVNIYFLPARAFEIVLIIKKKT